MLEIPCTSQVLFTIYMCDLLQYVRHTDTPSWHKVRWHDEVIRLSGSVWCYTFLVTSGKSQSQCSQCDLIKSFDIKELKFKYIWFPKSHLKSSVTFSKQTLNMKFSCQWLSIYIQYILWSWFKKIINSQLQLHNYSTTKSCSCKSSVRLTYLCLVWWPCLQTSQMILPAEQQCSFLH